MSTEQIEAYIGEIQERLDRRADRAKVIEGEAVDSTAVASTTPLQLEPPKYRSNRLMTEADTAIGPGAQAEEAQAAERVISVSPKILEPVGRHFGVPDGVLNPLPRSRRGRAYRGHRSRA